MNTLLVWYAARFSRSVLRLCAVGATTGLTLVRSCVDWTSTGAAVRVSQIIKNPTRVKTSTVDMVTD
ncbi:hypothetical protein HSB1_42040 [Halogranum salarium B-1]|uniref:Uncharacterized protein n=1 Tax=Halogranum salarium B-1 TaxID=1210908 RepID=J3JDI4_9EURY|nr:hypothetical protein HSB1_42040 [Halogranum salarium B-1]